MTSEGPVQDSGGPDPQTHREVERKLRVHALFRLPEIAGVVPGVAAVEALPTVPMTAVYHDTEDLRLFRWGVTLRRREGGADEGWHMKLPVAGAGGGVRDEVHVPLSEGAVGEVPWGLSTLVTALVREAPLRPVVTLGTERTPYRLLDDEGRQVAELVDDTVSVMDGDRVAAIFREIEVEAVPVEGVDSDAVLDAVAEVLVEEGAVPGSVSKAASALGPRTSAPPDVVVPAWPGPKGPAADAVRAMICTHVERLLLQDLRVRRDLPDAVHQMRVAARRLRSGLRVFRPLLDREWADGLREELGWAAGELGLMRDTEVLLKRLDDHAGELEEEDERRARAVIDPWLNARLDAARTDAMADFGSERHRTLLVDLVDAANHPRLTELAERPCREVLPPLVEHAWKRLAKDVDDLELSGPSETWHEARIAAKRARYAVDAVVPVFGKDAEALADKLSQVTELLGEHQDAHVARMTLRELAAHEDVDGPTGFALGLLHEYEGDQELLDRIAFEELWPTVRRQHKHTKFG